MRNTSVRKHTRTPELEHDFVRDPNLGYEPEGSYGYVRCLEHGFPNPLVRWHYHEEYELHLIVQTHGKVFVGDYIGQFEPGHQFFRQRGAVGARVGDEDARLVRGGGHLPLACGGGEYFSPPARWLCISSQAGLCPCP